MFFFLFAIDKLNIYDIILLRIKEMREEYKVFDKGFNKVLDLVSSAKGQAAEGFQNLVNILPNEVLEELENCEEFEQENQFYIASLCNSGNTLHLEFARRYNYLRSQLKIHRIFQKELEENDNIEIFEFVLKNTPGEYWNPQVLLLISIGIILWFCLAG